MAWNIADLIEHTVDSVPERVALIDERRSITYADLDARANRLAHHFLEVGVTKDAHVGIYAYNRVEFVESMLAAYKIRAVPINVNYRYQADELRYLFDNADLVALVYERGFGRHVAQVRSEMPLLRSFIELDDASSADSGVPEAVEYERALALAGADRDFGPRSDSDLYVLYTGGTTGMPKGVVWRHEDVLRVLGGGIVFETGEKIEDDWTFARAAAVTEPGTGIAIAPLMHGAAQWGTFGGLFRGNATVLLRRFEPHAVWDAVAEHRIGGLAITGDAMARPLIDALAERDHDVSSLRSVTSTAAVFSPAVKDAFLDRLPELVILEAVGSSESGYNGATMWSKGTAQRGGPTVTMGPDTLVLDEDLEPIEPGSGRIGRMARGGNVPLRYHKDPKKSEETFVEVGGRRFAIPGDFARVEADGRMTLLGRGSVCINSGGEKIFPEEVESVLKAHADVYDAVVVGVPDARWGQRVAAVVQPRAARRPALEDLAAHCRDLIAGYKVPRELHLVEEIRRSPSGKPDYPWAAAVAGTGSGVGTGGGGVPG